jgi:hypothetical protein
MIRPPKHGAALVAGLAWAVFLTTEQPWKRE